MLSESLRQRLETLNRDRLPEAAPAAAPARVALRPAQPPEPRKGDFCADGVVVQNQLGEHLLYRVPVEQLWPEGPELVSARLEHLGSKQPSEEYVQLLKSLPNAAAMLDLETCGLSGAALFLIGLLRWIDDAPTIELLFARHYGEEPAVLATLWDRLADLNAIATFNGKSFDWPMILDRSRRHLLHKRFELTGPTHLDMLHPARRKWKTILPDCKLQTIERMICRRARGDDIPGGQIPAAYDAYVRTGRDHEIRQVLHHNALDLVTLLDVTMRLVG